MYKVHIKFNNNIEDLTGKFYAVMIDDNAHYVLLFRDISNPISRTEKVERYSIPLDDIDSLEVMPLHENNGQTIPRC